MLLLHVSNVATQIASTGWATYAFSSYCQELMHINMFNPSKPQTTAALSERSNNVGAALCWQYNDATVVSENLALLDM